MQCTCIDCGAKYDASKQRCPKCGSSNRESLAVDLSKTSKKDLDEFFGGSPRKKWWQFWK